MEQLEREEHRDGLTYPQFLQVFTSGLIGTQSREQIMGMFKMIDEDDSGTIRLEDMRMLVGDIGESVTIEELRELISNATGGDAEISFEQFFGIFKRPTSSFAVTTQAH